MISTNILQKLLRYWRNIAIIIAILSDGPNLYKDNNFLREIIQRIHWINVRKKSFGFCWVFSSKFLSEVQMPNFQNLSTNHTVIKCNVLSNDRYITYYIEKHFFVFAYKNI